ncbi:hypothetical protein Q8W71_27200 [Methylobacterium sp. NEAU 140]|uniref:hypothetical protein n=1 Tax=Methylobacterium sp. NEAU 140 TaxID=3064945 RepID=UPI0027377970|nr:hypothetical protein [Methylobacterium sp. NEAU 140]MDP4026315.1 hypothetical protein [Methylobacterium sp. NEAU 140]
MARTERGRYRFAVKEDAEGVPSLALEPIDDGIAAFGDAYLCIELRPGVSYDHARQIADTLNATAAGLSATFFEKVADA